MFWNSSAFKEEYKPNHLLNHVWLFSICCQASCICHFTLFPLGDSLCPEMHSSWILNQRQAKRVDWLFLLKSACNILREIILFHESNAKNTAHASNSLRWFCILFYITPYISRVWPFSSLQFLLNVTFLSIQICFLTLEKKSFRVLW